MQKRFLGQTGIEVSTIGLGTVKFGRNTGVKYPNAFELPTDEVIVNLLSVAKELGINFLDTAPAYGQSEERLGQLLQGTRQEWVIATKVGETYLDGESHFDFSKKAISQSISRSLKRLRTDYLDIVLVHSSGNDVELIEQEHVFAELIHLKEQGIIRAFGMSTKTVAGGLLALQQSDVAMVTYNPSYTEERAVLDYAKEHNKGILVKKAFGSGHLNPAECLPFVLAHPGVTSVIIGTINAAHLRDNVAVG